jgi:hypothetical protein
MLLSWRNKAPALPAHVERAATVASVATDVASDMYASWKSKRGDDVEKQDEKAQSGHGYGFGRQAEKYAERKGFTISKPIETLPKYAPKPFLMRTGRDSPDSIKSAGRI